MFGLRRVVPVRNALVRCLATQKVVYAPEEVFARTLSVGGAVVPQGAQCELTTSSPQDTRLLRRDFANKKFSRPVVWLSSVLRALFKTQIKRKVDTELMYESCGKQALHPVFYNGASCANVCRRCLRANECVAELKLPYTYATQLELVAMHVWMCRIRLSRPCNDKAEAQLCFETLLEHMWDHVRRCLSGSVDPA